MARHGVQCSVHFIPLHLHTEWRRIVGDVSLPNAEEMFAGEVSLPIFSSMTDAQVALVINAVNACAGAS